MATKKKRKNKIKNKISLIGGFPAIIAIILIAAFIIVIHYDLVNNKKISLKNQCFTNKKEEICFTKKYMFIATEKGKQDRKKIISIEKLKGDQVIVGTSWNENGEEESSYYYDKTKKEYIVSIEDLDEINRYYYFYNNKKKELIGYKKINKEELKLINLEYYDKDGNIIIKDEYYLEGAYQTTDYESEFYVFKNNAIFTYDGELERNKVSIMNVNDYEIEYKFIEKSGDGGYGWRNFISDRNKTIIKRKGEEDYYKKINKEDLKYINMDYYNENTTTKPVDIDISGAYKYKNKKTLIEIYIDDNNMSLYLDDEDYQVDEDTISMKNIIRTDTDVIYLTNSEVERIKYNMITKEISAYIVDYVPLTKVSKKDLKHIDME